MGLKQSLQALCLLLSPLTATSAFLLPESSISKVKGIDHRRFAAGVDDLLDIVNVDASKANVMDGFMQAARENFQFTGTTTTVADSDSLRQSIASIRESVQSMKGSIETARESIKDSIDGSSTIIAESTDTMNKVPNESKLTASLQSSTGSLRNSLLSIKEAIQDFKESQGGAEAGGKSPLLADYIKSGVGIDHTHNSVGSVARSSSNIVANIADKQSAQPAVDDIVRSSGDYIHQSINSLMHTTTVGSGVESEVVAAAKIKLSMMIGNTYMLFGMDPPESLVRSGASISPAFHLFVAFFAVLLALGSKEIGKAQTHNHLQALSRTRNAKVVALDEQMESMGAEIKALDSEVPYLQNEIKEAKRRLKRTEFRVSLERKRLAGKLHALRRRAERIQRRADFKLEKSEELEATLSEAKRQNLESLRTLKKVRGIMHNHLNPRPLEHGIQVSHSVPFFVDTHETTSPTLAAWQSAAVKGEKFPHFAFQLLQM